MPMTPRYQFRSKPVHCCWEGIIVDTTQPHSAYCKNPNTCGCNPVCEINEDDAKEVCKILNSYRPIASLDRPAVRVKK